MHDAQGTSARRAATRHGARSLPQVERGYGGALLEGLRAARGTYVLTMDADLSHSPDLIRRLWQVRRSAEVLIASRYVAGGTATMPWRRLLLSRALNRAFSRGLSLRVRDMSSGFRLYEARALSGLHVEARDFDVLQEILVRLLGAGWRVEEVPFHYQPRVHGSSNARIFRSGWRTCAPSAGSGGLGTRSCRRTTMTVPTTVPYLSRILAARALPSRHGTDRRTGTGSWTWVVAPAGSSVRCRRAASVSISFLRKLRHARRFGKRLVCGSGDGSPLPGRFFWLRALLAGDRARAQGLPDS